MIVNIRVSHNGGGEGGGWHGGKPPPSLDFFTPSFIKVHSPPMGHLPHAEVKPPFEEMIPGKKTVTNTCISLIKQHWKKVAEIPQKHDFLT